MTVAFLVTIAGCDRPRPLNDRTQPADRAQPLQPPVEGPVSALPGRSPKVEPARGVDAIANAYAAESDEGKRRELIWEMLEAPPADGIAGVGRLLESEKRASLRVELFDSLDSFPGFESEKLRIVARELSTQRAVGEVRDAAIDALLNIQHRDAIPVWEALAAGGDEEIRDVANAAIAALRTLKQ